MTEQSVVQASGLEIFDLATEPGERVRGRLTARDREDQRLEVAGWAVGVDLPATEVEVTADGAVVGTSRIEIDRPDVAEKYPDAVGAATSGFRLELRARGSGYSRLEVHAVLEDGGREPLGRIVVKAGADGDAAAA